MRNRNFNTVIEVLADIQNGIFDINSTFIVTMRSSYKQFLSEQILLSAYGYM